MMRIMGCWLVIAATLFAAGAPSPPAKAMSPAQGTVNSISNALRAGQIRKVEVIQMHPWVLTRARITTQMLERNYDYKITIRDLVGFGARDKMIKTFGSVSVQPRDQGADLRWGVIFYSQDDRRVGVLYFDKSGRYGSVNDAPVSFEGDFFDWVDQTFSGCFQ